MQRYEDLKNNLFPASHAAIDDWFGFPWHRDRSNEIDTHKKHSSQAMAIDIFGTIKCSVDRDLVLDAIAETAGLPPGGPWRVELEWIDAEKLLGEPRPTQVDAIAIGSNTVLLIECKFTEPSGTCSQTKQKNGERQCNGNYSEQVNPLNGLKSRCALTAKGIRYWKYVPAIMELDADIDHSPCPFAKDAYQWMRNAVLAHVVGERMGLQSVVVAAFADGPNFTMAKKIRAGALDAMKRGAKRSVVPLSYQRIIQLACDASPSSDLWPALKIWIDDKVLAAFSG